MSNGPNILTSQRSQGGAELATTDGNVVPVTFEPFPGVSPGANTGGSYVFKPGGTASANTFVTGDALKAAVLAGGECAKTIYVDDSIVSPAVINVPNFPADGVTFDSVANYVTPSGGAALEFGPAATIQNAASGVAVRFNGGLQVTYTGTGTLISVGDDLEANIWAHCGCSFACPNGGIFALANGTGAGGFVVWLCNDNCVVGDGTNPVLSTTQNGLCNLSALSDTEVAANAVIGAGSIVTWHLNDPPAQGAGVTVQQNAFGAIQCTTSEANTLRGYPLGSAPSPLCYQQSASQIDITTNPVLTPDEYHCPVLRFFGVLTGNVVVTLPACIVANVTSPMWDCDFSGVTFGAHTAGFTAGSNTLTVSAAQLSATGQTGARLGVVGTNTVTRVS